MRIKTLIAVMVLTVIATTVGCGRGNNPAPNDQLANSIAAGVRAGMQDLAARVDLGNRRMNKLDYKVSIINDKVDKLTTAVSELKSCVKCGAKPATAKKPVRKPVAKPRPAAPAPCPPCPCATPQAPQAPPATPYTTQWGIGIPYDQMPKGPTVPPIMTPPPAGPPIQPYEPYPPPTPRQPKCPHGVCR